jgi:hypothetical protein
MSNDGSIGRPHEDDSLHGSISVRARMVRKGLLVIRARGGDSSAQLLPCGRGWFGLFKFLSPRIKGLPVCAGMIRYRM